MIIPTMRIISAPDPIHVNAKSIFWVDNRNGDFYQILPDRKCPPKIASFPSFTQAISTFRRGILGEIVSEFVIGDNYLVECDIVIPPTSSCRVVYMLSAGDSIED